jgi:hypothetical protein
MVLVLGYSVEPHNVFDHIWQSYIDAEGKMVQLLYYRTFLNVIRSIYDLKEYPIDLAGFYQDHIDPALQKSFRLHYPLNGQT